MAQAISPVSELTQGKIVQCIGAVVDIHFPRDAMPHVYDALKLDAAEAGGMAEDGLTFEVQQQLGDGVVRTIAMGSSDGLRRGIMVSNTGNPITVPVGKATLGRIMDVLGASPEDIAHEYGLSDLSIDRLLAYLRSSGRDLQGTDEEIRARLATPPEKMAGFIELLHEKYGSSEAFFLSQGVSAERIERVRGLLTARA